MQPQGHEDHGVRTLVIHQPSYLPWLGYFDQLDMADVHVFYDDVPYDKNGWRNRNRIKGPKGALWLTIPVHTRGRHGQTIREVRVADARWEEKHLKTLRTYYGKAPYFDWLFPELADLLPGCGDLLVDIDIAITTWLMEKLGIRTTLHRSSDLGIGGGQSERLLNLCLHFGTGRYQTAQASRTYLDVEVFRAAGIAVEFQAYRHPEYPQLHDAFVPYLSVVDLMFNCGPESLDVIRRGRAFEAV